MRHLPNTVRVHREPAFEKILSPNVFFEFSEINCSNCGVAFFFVSLAFEYYQESFQKRKMRIFLSKGFRVFCPQIGDHYWKNARSEYGPIYARLADARYSSIHSCDGTVGIVEGGGAWGVWIVGGTSLAAGSWLVGALGMWNATTTMYKQQRDAQ